MDRNIERRLIDQVKIAYETMSANPYRFWEAIALISLYYQETKESFDANKAGSFPKISESYAQALREADEVSPEDLEAASNLYDRIIKSK